MRPFVLITDHPPLTAVVEPLITALGYELRVVATWAEGMAIEQQGALVYLTPLPLTEEELAQHSTPLLVFVRRRHDAPDRIGSRPLGSWPRPISSVVIPFDPEEAWMRIIREFAPDQWERPVPVFPPIDQFWAGILDGS